LYHPPAYWHTLHCLPTTFVPRLFTHHYLTTAPPHRLPDSHTSYGAGFSPVPVVFWITHLGGYTHGRTFHTTLSSPFFTAYPVDVSWFLRWFVRSHRATAATRLHLPLTLHTLPSHLFACAPRYAYTIHTTLPFAPRLHCTTLLYHTTIFRYALPILPCVTSRFNADYARHLPHAPAPCAALPLLHLPSPRDTPLTHTQHHTTAPRAPPSRFCAFHVLPHTPEYGISMWYLLPAIPRSTHTHAVGLRSHHPFRPPGGRGYTLHAVTAHHHPPAWTRHPTRPPTPHGPTYAPMPPCATGLVRRKRRNRAQTPGVSRARYRTDSCRFATSTGRRRPVFAFR